MQIKYLRLSGGFLSEVSPIFALLTLWVLSQQSKHCGH